MVISILPTNKGVLKMKKEVLVEISARHVHVTKETLETLFGAGHTLTNKKDLCILN